MAPPESSVTMPPITPVAGWTRAVVCAEATALKAAGTRAARTATTRIFLELTLPPHESSHNRVKPGQPIDWLEEGTGENLKLDLLPRRRRPDTRAATGCGRATGTT